MAPASCYSPWAAPGVLPTQPSTPLWWVIDRAGAGAGRLPRVRAVGTVERAVTAVWGRAASNGDHIGFGVELTPWNTGTSYLANLTG